jgi:hypothetical protein
MTPELSRRCGWSLFVALALAAGAGLVALPSLDPLRALPRLEMPGSGLWLAGTVHALLAGAAGALTWHRLAHRVHPAWGSLPARAALLCTWLLGLSIWAVGALDVGAGDARALMWLELLPLWLGVAGLWGSAAGASGPVGQAQRAPGFAPHLGVVNQVDMRRAGDVAVPGTVEQGRRRREGDVVAVAVEADEPFAA